MAVHEASRDEGWAMFDKRCRRLLHVSADTFLSFYDRGGNYPAEWSHTHIVSVEMAIPFARPVDGQHTRPA